VLQLGVACDQLEQGMGPVHQHYSCPPPRPFRSRSRYTQGLAEAAPCAPRGACLPEQPLWAMRCCRSKLDSLLEERMKYYESADLKISLEGYCEDAEKGAPTAVRIGEGEPCMHVRWLV